MLPKRAQPTHGWPWFSWPLWPVPTGPMFFVRFHVSTTEALSSENKVRASLWCANETEPALSMTAETKGF